jgi:hypothetical protein
MDKLRNEDMYTTVPEMIYVKEEVEKHTDIINVLNK